MEAHQDGADLTKTDADGMTVLHNAARFNNKEVCQYILQNAPASFLDTLDKEKYVYLSDVFVRSILYQLMIVSLRRR